MYLPVVNVSFTFRITNHLKWRQPPWYLTKTLLEREEVSFMVVCWTSVQVDISFLTCQFYKEMLIRALPFHPDPTLICFCNKSEWNCKEATQSRSIYPGQQIEVSVVAIDQSNSAIPALIHTTVRSGHNLTVSETISYETGENCTSRNHSVTPKNLFNQLELYPQH